MDKLHSAVDEYLALRRSLGFDLRQLERSLRSFSEYLDAAHAQTITTELAVQWATGSSKVQPATWATRLSHVRSFAAWYATIDPQVEVPPQGLLPFRYRRQTPYIYTDAEVAALLEATATLTSKNGLRAVTYYHFVALLASTGMRSSEAVGLEIGDVDFDNGVLTVRRTKFGKSRLIPLHSSTRDRLRDYRGTVESIHRQLGPGFFVADRGSRITECSARYNFALVSQRVGIRVQPNGKRHGTGPRLHDLRHRFAVKTLIDWYRKGLDVERELPRLSTYLGHVHLYDTYWYLQAVPELLQLATERVVPVGKVAP